MARRKKLLADPNQLTIDFDAVLEALFQLGSVSNISHMLPQLFGHQQEDVAKAEERYKVGKGMMFTNGTGVGKTFLGLGIIKRFVVQDKNDILIIVPTDKKAKDWIEEGKIVGVDITQLNGIKDPGRGVCVTTYANYRDNVAIENRTLDLLVYDESHYLNQNEKGNATSALDKHKIMARLPSHCLIAAADQLKDPPGDHLIDGFYQRVKEWKEKRLKIAQEMCERTKVLFLSATPFAYRKSIQYIDGCLIDICETFEDEDYESGYNTARGFDKFLQDHFGYHMKYGKLNHPDVGVNIDLMERNFFENMKEMGVLSTRQLELDYDYSRDFFIVDSDIGNYINEGMEMFYTREFSSRYKNLSSFIHKKWNYLFINQLLECIKARELAPRIKKHLELNRKIVIFHSYNNSVVPHPFKFQLKDFISESSDDWNTKYDIEREIQLFNQEYSHLVNLDLSNIKNTVDQITSDFPETLLFNGKIPKKKRSNYVELFNDVNSGCNIILVQTKAGREGISLHDKIGLESGGMQRVIITIGLPTEPTASIQQEGRIYRAGLKSNSVYEYPTVQTNFERLAFADKISIRSKTAENLAMGNLARDLETSFKEGYINASYFDPHEEQGVGGKEKDRIVQDISEFEKAKTYYWSKAKKNAKTKAKEGLDYFATPEPLGYKMVEWLNPFNGEKGLEPSAGHGAIARWFPHDTNNVFVEPSLYLRSELSINSFGECIDNTFENYNIVNKFHFLAMNPPFGKGGKTAVEHLAKALTHIKTSDSRLACIVPNGPMCNKRLEELYESKFFSDYILQGQIFLPECTFERAGTKVSTKIVFISYLYNRKKPYNDIYFEHDLTYVNKIDGLFNAIENLKIKL